MEIAPAVVPQESRAEATARLFAERRTAGAAARRRIEEELIRRNMRVAADATRRFRGRGIATEDLEQVAYVGLVKAVQGFDPDRGHDFLSFAIPTIRGEVRRHFRDLGWTVRPPRSIAEDGLRLSTRRGKQFNTMVHNEIDPLTGAARDSVFVSDADADRLGLADGAPVLVRSRHGELHALVHRAPLRPGNVQVFYPEGNVLLPGGRRDRSGVPDYNTTVELVPRD